MNSDDEIIAAGEIRNQSNRSPLGDSLPLGPLPSHRETVFRATPTKTRFQTLHFQSIEDELDFFYDFVSARIGKELQSLLRLARRPSSGGKTDMRCRFMLHVHSELVRNILPFSLLNCMEEKDVNDHLEITRGKKFAAAPKIQLLKQGLSSETERKLFRRELKVCGEAVDIVDVATKEKAFRSSSNLDSADVPSSRKTPDFNDNEFARLLLLIRDDEKTKRNIYALASTISSAQPDAGVRQNYLWERIANRFNDEDFVPFNIFLEPISNINASLKPLAKRNGIRLSSVWRENKKVWTSVLSKYEVSGNNGEIPFIDFCHKHTKTKDLSAVGRRTFITFSVFGLDNEDIDTVVGRFL
eukprot:TRINITY_DN3232_c0_g1_i1.p1 TRINITY_DN3232_c0_g1~~TRINITY_DN3232_c0_g1_i1.p1  ORF type:complete len:356 (-),score=40.10 TRINITY_DN3232_c0_g1_i1:4430-5497(-)